MQGRIQKRGSYYALHIPKSVADELQWKQGTPVEATVQEGKLVIETIKVPDYNLEFLLKDMTTGNFQGEVDSGLPIGKEVW